MPFTASCFIVSNIWGTSLGDGGFACASDDYAPSAFIQRGGAVLWEVTSPDESGSVEPSTSTRKSSPATCS